MGWEDLNEDQWAIVGESMDRAKERRAKEQANNPLYQAQQAAIAAQNAATNSAIAGYNAQKGTVEQQTARANTGAYNSLLKSVNPFGTNAEAEAMLGNRGLAESTKARYSGAYQNAVNNNEQTRMNALKDIDLAIQQAELNGDIARANILAQYGQMIAQRQYDYANTQQNYAMQQAQWKAQQDQQAWENQFAKDQWEYQKWLNEQNKAK
jgi:hypothetical protein